MNYMTETEKILAWRDHRNRVQRVRRRFWVTYGVIVVILAAATMGWLLGVL